MNRYLGIFMIALGLIGCGGGGDDPSQEVPSDESKAINVSSPYEGTIERTIQLQYFSFTPEAGLSYSIDISNQESSSGSLFAGLLESDRSKLTEETLVLKSSTKSIDYYAESNSPILIGVRASGNTFQRFLITVHPSTDDGLVHDQTNLEPNNSLNAAFPMIDQVLYQTDFSKYDDADYYRVEVSSGQTVDFYLENKTESSTLFLEIYDEDGLPITDRIFSSGSVRAEHSVTSSYDGNIYAAVTQSSPNNNVNYTIQSVVFDRGFPVDQDDPNILSLSTPLEVSLEAGSFQNRYVFRPKSNQSYSIDVVNLAASDRHIRSSLLDVNRLPITEDTFIKPTDSVSYDYESSSDDPIYIAIRPESSGFRRFVMTVHPSTEDGLFHDTVTLEPNNSFNSAYPIIDQVNYSTNLFQYDNEDYYALSITEGLQANFVFDNQVNGTVYVQLFDKNRNALSDRLFVNESSDLEFNAKVDYDGLLYLHVTQSTFGREIPYGFSVTITSSD